MILDLRCDYRARYFARSLATAHARLVSDRRRVGAAAPRPPAPRALSPFAHPPPVLSSRQPTPFLRHLALGVAAGVGVGIGAGALLVQQQQQQQRRHDPSSSSSSSSAALGHPAAKYGLPQQQTLRAHQGFLTMFDSATRNPAWVVEHVREELNGDADRGNSFFYEDEGELAAGAASGGGDGDGG